MCFNKPFDLIKNIAVHQNSQTAYWTSLVKKIKARYLLRNAKQVLREAALKRKNKELEKKNEELEKKLKVEMRRDVKETIDYIIDSIDYSNENEKVDHTNFQNPQADIRKWKIAVLMIVIGLIISKFFF